MLWKLSASFYGQTSAADALVIHQVAAVVHKKIVWGSRAVLNSHVICTLKSQ